MYSFHRVILSCSIAISVTLKFTSAMAGQDAIENCYNDPHFYCINDPAVTQAITSIDNIVVYQGDRVWLRAGGCVQTGGHGSTWKRYVNPSGPNSYILYHGEIQIPGAVETMTFLNYLVGDDGSWSRMWTIGVADPNFFPGTINIGYTDDGYDDNGYYAHDNGTGDQCNGVGNAWLQIYICRADPAHGATC